MPEGRFPTVTIRARCMVQIWEGIAAIQTAIGEDWRQPLKLSDEQLLIDAASVERYDLADAFRAEVVKA